MLSETQLQDFYEKGFVILRDIFSKNEITEMSYATRRLQHQTIGLDGEFMVNGSKFVIQRNLLERVVWAGATEPMLLHYGRDKRLTGMVAQLLGSDYANHLINQVHFKLPDGGFYPWHQDSGHRGYGTEDWKDINGRGSYVQMVTAIDEATTENGPLMFIPATTYECGHLYLPYDKAKQTVSDKFNPNSAISALMQPGDVVLFGPYTIHGSEVNKSTKPRRAFINGFAYPGANRKEYPGKGAGELIRLV